MGEEENITEIQKPKFSKLAIVAVMCCLLGVILYYVGANFMWTILPWVYGVPSHQLYTKFSQLLKANSISRFIQFSGAMLWALSVVLSCVSQELIKRSKGKLRGKWLALGAAVVSIGLLAWFSIGYILIENIIYYFKQP
ncbi:MAG: hypothetical protein ACFFDT_29760 [Candidatus Hodarchaeota archaeon]